FLNELTDSIILSTSERCVWRGKHLFIYGTHSVFSIALVVNCRQKPKDSSAITCPAVALAFPHLEIASSTCFRFRSLTYWPRLTPFFSLTLQTGVIAGE